MPDLVKASNNVVYHSRPFFQTGCIRRLNISSDPYDRPGKVLCKSFWCTWECGPGVLKPWHYITPWSVSCLDTYPIYPRLAIFHVQKLNYYRSPTYVKKKRNQQQTIKQTNQTKWFMHWQCRIGPDSDKYPKLDCLKNRPFAATHSYL